jgi:HopA1 effector protein family
VLVRGLTAARPDLLAAVALARAHAATHDRAALAQLLYTAWFTRTSGMAAGDADGARTSLGEPPAGNAEGAPASHAGGARTSLAARLRAAHAATGRFEPGWTARSVGAGGALVAERRGERLQLLPPDYLNVGRPAAPVVPGDALAVTARRDWPDADGAWWITSGGAESVPAGGLARVYWNCPAPAAEALVAAVTGALERRRLPYTLKCPLSEALFDRVEPVVLYLAIDAWAGAKPVLREVHASLANRLRAEVPPLTLRLGRGAAAGEDPGDGRSFGESRTAAVADGIVAAAERGVTEEEPTIALLAERLRAHDIAPERPYLCAGSPPELLTPW